VGDDVATGDGVRDVEFGTIIVNGDGKGGADDSITIACKQVVMDLVVLCEWKTQAVLRGS
jgi:hypothetical protein